MVTLVLQRSGLLPGRRIGVLPELSFDRGPSSLFVLQIEWLIHAEKHIPDWYACLGIDFRDVVRVGWFRSQHLLDGSDYRVGCDLVDC